MGDLGFYSFIFAISADSIIGQISLVHVCLQYRSTLARASAVASKMLIDLLYPRAVHGGYRNFIPSGTFHFRKSSVTFWASSGFHDIMPTYFKTSPSPYLVVLVRLPNSEPRFHHRAFDPVAEPMIKLTQLLLIDVHQNCRYSKFYTHESLVK